MAPALRVMAHREETNKRTGKVTVKSAAFFCSDTTDETISSEKIVGWYVSRWNIEVTFEERGVQLGLETQRQLSVRLIGRTTPYLFRMSSLAVLMAQRLHPHIFPCIRAVSTARRKEPSAMFWQQLDGICGLQEIAHRRRNSSRRFSFQWIHGGKFRRCSPILHEMAQAQY